MVNSFMERIRLVTKSCSHGLDLVSRERHVGEVGAQLGAHADE